MTNIKLFQDKKIRSAWNEEEEQWYFVVEDAVAALTDSSAPKQYVKRLKQRDAELAKGWVQFVPTLVVPTAELFATSVPNINIHTSNILKDKELDSNSVIKDYLITAN